MFLFIFLHKDIDINLANRDGETPLFEACYQGRVNIVKLLLSEPNTDINIQTTEVKTITMETGRSSDFSLLAKIFGHGPIFCFGGRERIADVDPRGSASEKTQFSRAAEKI